MPVKTVPSVIIGSGSNKSIVNNIYNNDFGNTIITGYLTVDFYLTVDGNLTVGGNFDLAGSFELSGDITVKNPSDVTVFSVDSATGDTLTKGDITVKNSSDVTKFSVDSDTGNTTIEGDLTVNGTTTTIDSVTLVVEDPVITLAKNANSNPTSSTDAGLFLQRGSTENPAIIIWNETLNQFEVATVTGASSTTTNFTGGGVTKTFATFKAGNIYGSSIDIGGLGSFGSLSSGSLSIGEHTFNLTGITLGEYGNLNIHSIQDYSSIILNYDVTSGIPSANAVIEVKRGSSTSSKITWDEGNDRWDFNFGLYLNTDSQLKMEKPTSDSTPVILLNADKTGSLQESTVVALGVERGLETNSYLKWDETTDSWEFSNSLILNESLKFNNNLVPVYFYVRYTSTSLADNEYIYIFSTQDNGITRDVIRIASLSGSLTENSSLGYYRYKASTSTTYSNGNPPIVDGIIYLDPNKTYYFNMDSTDIQGNDFQVYFSTTILVTPPTYRNVFVGFSVSTTSANIVYSLISNTTLQDSDILRRVDDGVVEISTMDGATTVDDIDIIPIRIPSKKDNQSNTVILLNSDETGSPSKSVQIEVERGTSTNALITWNETYDYWGISPAISSDLIYTTDLRAGSSTFNYLGEYQNEDLIIVVKNPSLDTTFSINGGGDVFANGQISTNMPSLSTTPAILLNADRSGPGEESSVIALSVNRGEEISSNIKWDESNDRWDFNYGLYLNTDSQLKIGKPSTPSTTPAILLNADRTGSGEEADVIAIEVERGILTNAKIKWDEGTDRWDFNSNVYLSSDVVLNTSSLNTTTINGTANFEHDVNLGNGSNKNIAINGTATFNSKLILGISNLTISAGAVTVTNAYHKIDTEASAATDNLDTINGGVEGMILVLQSAIQGHEVVVRDIGNIRLSTASFHLDNVQDTLTLIYNGSLWCEISQSNNA